MKRSKFQKALIGGGIAATLLALGLYLSFGVETNTGDGVVEPLDEYTKAQLRGTGLGFIAETGRIVTNPSGHREIIWDPPQLPTLEESIRVHAEAAEKGDTDLILYCTDELSEYLKAQKELSGESAAQGDSNILPTCQGIPGRIVKGPNRTRAQRP